jgi:hypothetical protein
MLRTSAVAIFFSSLILSGATDLSDRFWVQFLLQAPFSETPYFETRLPKSDLLNYDRLSHWTHQAG